MGVSERPDNPLLEDGGFALTRLWPECHTNDATPITVDARAKLANFEKDPHERRIRQPGFGRADL